MSTKLEMEKEREGNSSTNQNNSNFFKTPTGILIPKKKNKSKRKKNKLKHKNLSCVVKKGQFSKKGNLEATVMSSWEEAFTKAAAWQYKHQIAYWKAKAKALQYENRVLHDIIRKRHGDASTSEVSYSGTTSEVDSDIDDVHIDSDSSQEKVSADPDLEVSEAFIEFLSSNAKFKEEARQERERLRALHCDETEEAAIKRMEEPPVKSPEERSDELKKLYGSKWREVSALETSLQTKLSSDCDRLKPTYWPNIPFNFNYS